MGIRTHSEYTEALLSQSEEIESTGGSFLFELNSADVQFFSIMYKILMRVFVVIFATKVHVFCNFCDSIARDCDFCTLASQYVICVSTQSVIRVDLQISIS